MSARWVFLVIPLLWIAGVPGHAQKDVYIPEVEDAMVQGDAVVRDHALVYGGTYSENAAVQDFAIANQTMAARQARLQGNVMSWGSTYEGEVVVGGDAETEGCAERIYLQVPHPIMAANRATVTGVSTRPIKILTRSRPSLRIRCGSQTRRRKPST